MTLPELAKLLEAATPGPWHVDDSHPEHHISAAYRSETGGRGHTVSAVEFKHAQGRADLEAVVALVNAAPRLLALAGAAVAWRTQRGPGQAGSLTDALEAAIDALGAEA
jgi:hypothetical protein